MLSGENQLSDLNSYTNLNVNGDLDHVTTEVCTQALTVVSATPSLQPSSSAREKLELNTRFNFGNIRSKYRSRSTRRQEFGVEC